MLPASAFAHVPEPNIPRAAFCALIASCPCRIDTSRAWLYTWYSGESYQSCMEKRQLGSSEPPSTPIWSAVNVGA